VPISFLELAPKRPRRTVTIEAEDGAMAEFEITGVALAQLAEIGRKFPAFARVLDGSPGGMFTATEAMPALVAAALGHAGDIEYEKKAASLPPDILLGLAGEVVKLTLPHRPITALAESDEPGEGINGAQPDQILPPRLSS
jgi:hypothetical protein